MTEELDSPTMVGLLRPVVLVPSWMAADGAGAKLDWSLRHELTHCKWLDPAAILVRDLAAILFYFHPAAWWAAKRQTEAMELACDRALIKNDSDASNYAEQLYQILKSIQHRRRVAVTGGLFATRTQVGKRIAALLDGRIAGAGRLTPLSVAGVLVVAITALAVGGAVQNSSQADPDRDKVQGQGRVVHFPKDRSLGTLLMQDADAVRHIRPFSHWIDKMQWVKIGQARGDVAIPPGKRLLLIVSPAAEKDLSPLASLRPDDLHTLKFRTVNPGQGTAGDGCMQHIAKLSGLEELDLWQTKITSRGLRRLRSLPALARLTLPAGTTDAGLACVGDLKSLRGLIVCTDRTGSDRVTDAGLSHLGKLTRLRELTLACDRITDQGLAHLARLPSLDSLNLWGPVLPRRAWHISIACDR